MSLLLLAGFSSCKNDDPEPPKPPVVEDVLGSYSAENLALTVTGGTPGANPEVVLLQSDGKTKVRGKNRHYLKNEKKTTAKVLWISTPPLF